VCCFVLLHVWAPLDDPPLPCSSSAVVGRAAVIPQHREWNAC
jgi:hypothetical protein